MKLKFFLRFAIAVSLFIAAASFADCPTAPFSTPQIPYQIFAGSYGQGDALVFKTSSTGGWYYFNLTGTEASREMASIVKLAYAKSKYVQFNLTGTKMGTWQEVCTISVTN
jgi:hypothetical protein